MRDISLNSSIKLKFEDKLFGGLPAFVQLVNLELFCQFCKSKQKPFHVCNLYNRRKESFSNFGLIEETMDQFCIFLAVQF
jgi:hypothetical protein